MDEGLEYWVLFETLAIEFKFEKGGVLYGQKIFFLQGHHFLAFFVMCPLRYVRLVLAGYITTALTFAQGCGIIFPVILLNYLLRVTIIWGKWGDVDDTIKFLGAGVLHVCFEEKQMTNGCDV